MVRGYIFSRRFMGERVPQHVQNLVLRDYCQKHSLEYLLSAVEYEMPNCHLILHQVLEELPRIDGIALYSIFQLPENKNERENAIRQVLEYKKTLHFAVEGLQLKNETEYELIETIWQVQQTLPRCLNYNKV